jgi:hypothetical protein
MITSDSTAKNVRAKITYLRLDGSIIGSVNGAWAVDESGSKNEEIIELLSVGKPRTLYLAMKYKVDYDNNLYMYGMETSVTYLFKRHEDDTFRIKENPVDIKVEIIGERVKLDRMFRLYDEQAGLRIEVLNDNQNPT